MDNGEVIPGLNEGWTFGGAKLMEWIAGLTMSMIVGGLFKLHPMSGMPLFLILSLGTTFGLASLRKNFPDAERGVANLTAASLGFPPPGIPKPARIQPVWSGAPLRKLEDENLDYVYLELDKMFELIEEEKEEDHV